MSVFPIDPAAEWLECDACEGRGYDPNDSPCYTCDGTGRIPNPDAPKEILIQSFQNGAFFAWIGMLTISTDDPQCGIEDALELALAAAREALSK